MPADRPVLVVRDPDAPDRSAPVAAEAVAQRLAQAFDGIVAVDVGGSPDAATAILRRARDADAGLIVIPTGRFVWAGTPRALEGPGRWLARRADRPVLLVPDDAAWRTPPVLAVATDFSRAARRAVDWTHRLARSLDARLLVLHAPEPPDLPPDAPPYLTRSWMQTAVRGRASDRLDELMDRLESEDGVRIETREVDGAGPAAALARAAEREGVCLLSVGALGLGPVRDRLLGPTAEGVLSRYRGTVAVVAGSAAAASEAARDDRGAVVTEAAAEPSGERSGDRTSVASGDHSDYSGPRSG